MIVEHPGVSLRCFFKSHDFIYRTNVLSFAEFQGVLDVYCCSDGLSLDRLRAHDELGNDDLDRLVRGSNDNQLAAGLEAGKQRPHRLAAGRGRQN